MLYYNSIGIMERSQDPEIFSHDGSDERRSTPQISSIEKIFLVYQKNKRSIVKMVRMPKKGGICP